MISDFKDPAIRLFGRSIQLEPNDNVSAELSPSDDNLSVSFQSSTCHKNPADDPMNNLHPCSPSSILDHNSKQSSISSSSEDSPPQEKATKILPCPRCNSLNTKFCYFNNYNLKQPRHFCKDCHRYWTAGGSMRKMSIGAGRRKNKQNNNFNQDSQNLAIAPQLPIWLGFLPVQFYTPTPEFHPTLTLGKHPREHQESTVLVPKTLRFDDPNEAAQSSIWNTLGIKNASFFGGFDSKADETSSISRVLQANPAALSRSLTFHETTAESQFKAAELGIH